VGAIERHLTNGLLANVNLANVVLPETNSHRVCQTDYVGIAKHYNMCARLAP
jgi:hypothetical protein